MPINWVVLCLKFVEVIALQMFSTNSRHLVSSREELFLKGFWYLQTLYRITAGVFKNFSVKYCTLVSSISVGFWQMSINTCEWFCCYIECIRMYKTKFDLRHVSWTFVNLLLIDLTKKLRYFASLRASNFYMGAKVESSLLEGVGEVATKNHSW